MKLLTYQYNQKDGWNNILDASLDSSRTLIIAFGSSNLQTTSNGINDLKLTFPNSLNIGCSSAGEIYQDEIFDDSLSVAVIYFEKSDIQQITVPVIKNEALQVGEKLLAEIETKGLKAVFVLSDGLNVNGSALIQNITESLPDDVIITGGLAADGDKFQETWVLSGYKAQQGIVSMVAFYGDDFCIGHGSKGGWDVMGVDRLVTRSIDNVLFELDGKPALTLYKEYLGERAKDLPASGLLFPLSIQNKDEIDSDTVRTILAIDEEQQSITFAGNIPEGATVRLMHANFDRLIDGAYAAADNLLVGSANENTKLAIAISCVGRRLVLGQRSEEEVEATLDILPENTKQIGFYSYGEISPLASGQCDLHNQTMTLTLLSER